MISIFPTKLFFYPGNTQDIAINGLVDRNGTPLNSDTVSGTLYDWNGNPVQGCVNVILNYVPGSNGNYLGTFGNASFQPAIGTGYTLVIDGTGPSGDIDFNMIVEIIPRSG